MTKWPRVHPINVPMPRMMHIGNGASSDQNDIQLLGDLVIDRIYGIYSAAENPFEQSRDT
jgi:hypothetical protein